MRMLKRSRNYFIMEPFHWLFRCFFQPARFQKDFAQIPFSRRIAMMLRLFLPLLLCTYPYVLLIRISIFCISPHLYRYYLMQGTGDLNIAFFLFDATWATAASCVIGSLFGSIFGAEYGIAFGLAAGAVDGIIINLRSDILIIILFGLAAGLLLGMTFNSTGAMKYGGLRTATVGIVYGIAAGSGCGLLTGIFCGFWAGSALLFLGRSIGFLNASDSSGILGNVVGIIAGVVTGCFVMKVMGMIAKGNQWARKDVVDIAIRVGIAVAGILGAVVGLATGDYGMQGNKSLFDAIAIGSMYGIGAGATFLVSYVPGYYRLPLYPVSALAMLRSYFSSRKDPAYVFHYLYHSSLHWDECVFPPLPHLKHILLIAAEQNKDEALSEISFILQERPQQNKAARAVALEIALNDLNWRESLRDISGAQRQLAVTVMQEIRRAHPPIASVIQRLEGASQDATNYYTQISWQGRSQALTNMLANLQKASACTVFNDALLNLRLEKVIQNWQEAARHELEKLSLKRVSEEFGRIENPYVPGLILEQRDPLFVGRRELTQKLSEALCNHHPPTFFLSGERRMGKSSILKQLPVLLGSHYLPIFYDLQSTGITSSIAALLAAIAEEVHDMLLTRGMLVRKLGYEQLKDALRDNEAVVYHRFSHWLKEVEHVLTQEDRVLLLMFDEFEKLTEAEQKGYLDLGLLFGWFRSMIQHQSHLVLLFSGVKSISEMGSHWPGYFVNVELLKVSFLQPEEAQRLIIHPVPDFPGEHIFDAEVTQEIVRVTGCHPFLVQALCSALITRLNNCSRQQANIDDVTIAIEEIFKKWGDSYFGDLWDRTDQELRMCLKAICASSSGTAHQIQKYCALDEATVASHLEKLIRRDILCCDDGEYRIIMPILAQWLASQ